MSTARCAPLSGVSRRGPALDQRQRARRGRCGTHTPQPRHRSASSRATVRFGWCGSLAETAESASTGQARTQRSQPLQAPSSTAGRNGGGVDGVGRGEAPGGDHRLAAAAAAVADEVHALPDVLAELHEAALVRLVQQVEPLGDVDRPGVAVPDERAGGGVEGHADVLRRVAGPPHVLHLVAAVAEADAPVRGGRGSPRWRARSRGRGGRSPRRGPARGRRPGRAGSRRRRRAPGRSPPRRSGTGRRARPGPSGRRRWRTRIIENSKKPAMGGGSTYSRALRPLPVDEERPGGQRVQPWPAPRPRPTFQMSAASGGGEGPDGEHRDQRRLPLAEEHLQDLEEALGGRRALREPVQPLGEPVVDRSRGVVGHVRLRRGSHASLPQPAG